MNLNWIAIIVAFVITIVIAIISGLYLPKNAGLIGPIIGGLIAGYLVGGDYTNGIVNGGIPAGIAGLIYILAVVLLLGSTITSAALAVGYSGSIGTLTAVAAIGGAFVGFCIYFVLGLIGGIIGVAIKKRKSN
jgi:hypothetical protein